MSEKEVWRGGGQGGSLDKLRKQNPLPQIDNHIKFYDYIAVDPSGKPDESFLFDVRGALMPNQRPLPAGWRILNHKYFVDGIMMRESLTSFLQHFHEHFDEQEHALRLANEAKPGSEYFGKSKDEILKMWDDNRVNGTRMHEYLELYYNDMHNPSDERAKNRSFEHFKRYQEEFVKANRLVPFRTELRNFDRTESDTSEELCGTADMIYQREEDINDEERGFNVIIVDWKFLKKMYTTAFGNRYCRPPFQNLPDTNLSHYYIQLNGYKYLVNQRTSLVVTDMLIADFGEQNETYQLYEVPDMQAEFLLAVEYRKAMYFTSGLRKRKRDVEELAGAVEELLTKEPELLPRLASIKEIVAALVSAEKRLAPHVCSLLLKRNKELRTKMGVGEQTQITDFFVPKGMNELEL